VPARLHHERIARSDSKPSRWLLLTHGIYGAGSNLRQIARKLNDQRRDWGVVLVDLRNHGRSESGEPPHTIEACAGDLEALIAELGDIAAIAGHSFGGKVVLATRPRVTVDQTWLLDSSPSARPGALDDSENSVVAVLELMERLPRTWASRDDFVAAVSDAGHASVLANWLAMNVVADSSGQLALRLDLAAIRAMLEDYYAQDHWSTAFAPGGEVHVVAADRAQTISAEDLARLASAPSHVHTHHIAAGHWLHVEAPGAVVELFAAHLPQ
jgi:pimeloyl-ACP methyl ester carboxylesterase